MALGIKSERETPHDEKLRQRNACGKGDPQHEPEVETQEYVDIDSGRVWKWFGGEWH